MMFCKESEFQESPIGKIPEHWGIQELSDFVEIETGKRAKGGGLSEGTVASIGGEHIDWQGNILWSNMKYIPNDFYNLLKQGMVQIGDILLVKDGATTGKVAIVKHLKYEKVAVNEHIFLIRSKTERLSNEFLYYFLFSEFGQRQIKTRFHGLIGGIIRNDLENVLVTIPSIVEQRGVVGVLGVFDSAVELIDRVIAKTERLKKGLMQELLTKGIRHKEYKQTPIGKIPKEWEVTPLEELCTAIVDCPHTTPKFTDKGVLVIRNFNIREGQPILESAYYTTEEEWGTRTRRCVPENDDVLFSREAPIGEACLAPTNTRFSLGQRTMLLRPNKTLLNSLFLVYVFYSPFIQHKLRNLEAGVTAHHVNVADIRRLKIPVPSISEQERIASIISATVEKLNLERNEKAKLERIKWGLMDLLLTGRVRAKED